MRKYHIDGTLPEDDSIVIFGSNDRGFHSLGMALIAAKRYGAIRYQAEGLMGQCYAIPTRWWDHRSKRMYTLPFEVVAESIAKFCQFTLDNPDLHFFVTSVGCGHAQLDYEHVAPLFKDAINCSFPENWDMLLEE